MSRTEGDMIELRHNTDTGKPEIYSKISYLYLQFSGIPAGTWEYLWVPAGIPVTFVQNSIPVSAGSGTGYLYLYPCYALHQRPFQVSPKRPSK
jgi:hypothetical protein